MVGVAVNVTGSPIQIVVEDAAMLTEGVTLEFTVMVMVLEVAGEPVAQLELDVITTVITSPFASPVVV